MSTTVAVHRAIANEFSVNDNTSQNDLSREELLRYSRHLILPEVGTEGQRTLRRSRVLLIGAGGLGSPSAMYLAAAGVGTLGIVDFDKVDASNLQRQILHGSSDVGKPKIESAKETLREINPHVHVEGINEPFTSGNALRIARDFDVIVDGTDNFATRYLTNDTAVLLGKPNVYGSIFRFEGQASVFATQDGPCYRCLFREPPPPGLVPSCAEGGVLGVLPGLIGTIQATETIKLLLGIGSSLAGRLLLVDTLEMRFRTVQVRRDPQCPACGTREIKELIDYEEFCGAPLPHKAEAVAESVNGIEQLTPEELQLRISRGDDLQLIDVREDFEWDISHLGGAEHIPMGILPDKFSSLDKNRPVVFYCRTGRRSQRAAEAARAQGFDNLANLAGGIVRWEEEGRETE
jgi:adenylyltransferase/sulfurtransferase